MSKKTSKAAKDAYQYANGDTVLGKIRGYPPWPGVVVDPNDCPPAVQNEAPSGKRTNVHCIMFFPAGEFAWVHGKDMSSLKRHEIEAFLADDTKKRNGDLRDGYTIALNPQEWLNEHLDKARAAQDAVENEQVDQLESEGEGEEEGTISKKAKTSKKRKRESEAADAPKAPKKTQKAKKESVEPAKKKSASTPAKPRRKPKSAVESEDEAEAAGAEEEEDEDAGPSKKASPPPAKKAKREKDEDGDDNKTGDPQSMKVRDWRHKLQKTFLSNKPMAKAESIPEVDQLFTTVETYNEMTIEQLQFSKIGKVMRHIAALSDEKMPPRDDEFHFRARAKGLVDKWHQILNANKAPGPAAASASAVTANNNNNAAGDASPSAPPAAQANGAENGTGDKTDTEKMEVEPEAKKDDVAAGDTDVDADADADMAQGTKNLDINGKVDVPEDQDAPAEADPSVADVAMTEA